MIPILFRAAVLTAIFLSPLSAWATQAKIDADTCTSLRLEQIKFRQSGIMEDLEKGAAWAKANLSADRLREIEHYLQLDEQVKFGCRDAKLSPEAEKASEAAARIEINSDADPTAPIVKDPPKPGSAAKSPDEKKPAPKKAAKKKTKPADDKSEGEATAKAAKTKQSNAAPDTAPHPPVILQSQSESPPRSSFGGDGNSGNSELPAFGFGEMSVLPHSAP